ncbi:MAG: RNase adapter RapZ [Polyangiaceae bacterium]
MSDGGQVVIVTGLSGAGKSTALRALDDVGYYCIDNLPPPLVSQTVSVCQQSGLTRVALGMDVRVGAFLDSAAPVVAELAKEPGRLEVLFLEASDALLVRRYSETRRPHPVFAVPGAGEPLEDAPNSERSVVEGVALERERLMALSHLATLKIDTTHDSVHELRRQIIDIFGGVATESGSMTTRFMSFGFKHGIPLDADLVFDVRFLDNPHFVPELRDRTGRDQAVSGFVLASDGCAEFADQLEKLLRFSLPRYESEPKSYLTVAIGCTGGRHRSVALVEELAKRLRHPEGRDIAVTHRDSSRTMGETVPPGGKLR